MAKFINTRKAVSELEDLIRNAGERLILCSPYLKLSKDFRQLLEFRNGKDKITTVIFRKQELKPDELRFFQGLRFVILKFNEDLHAKCYVSDDKMIITSLNLYEFSMANNKEMGVLIDKNDPADSQLFQDAMAEIDFIQSTGQRFDLTMPVEAPAKPAAISIPAPSRPDTWGTPAQAPRGISATGYCIRTRVEIPFDLKKPLSPDAYKKWNEYGDADYPEKFCHFSGESSGGETTYDRPVLKKNWKKAQAIHKF